MITISGFTKRIFKNPTSMITIACCAWAAIIVYLSAEKGIRFFAANIRLVLFAFGASMLIVEIIKLARRDIAAEAIELLDEARHTEENMPDESAGASLINQ